MPRSFQSHSKVPEGWCPLPEDGNVVTPVTRIPGSTHFVGRHLKAGTPSFCIHSARSPYYPQQALAGLALGDLGAAKLDRRQRKCPQGAATRGKLSRMQCACFCGVSYTHPHSPPLMRPTSCCLPREPSSICLVMVVQLHTPSPLFLSISLLSDCSWCFLFVCFLS